ncbi:ABC transporter permease [Synergistales bacterium]|nr:ABC transporter permease [Synergistales bacterium]
MEILSASMISASFFILVGIGQMLVITTGPGNIDLSVPYVISFVGATACAIMGASNMNLPHGVVLGLLLGAAIGAFNFALIRFILMPPMIATLASSLIVSSLNIYFFRALLILPPSGLMWWVNRRLFGAPVLFLLVVLLAGITQVVLTRTKYGRFIHAIGQNIKAAWLSGINVNLYKLISYMLSSMFAGLTGILLAAYIGGATVDMGSEYMLNSVAVVVLGGSSIAGGDSNSVGIVGASILLYMIVNLLNTLRLEAGWRYVITGLVIVAIIFISGDRMRRRG